MNNLKSYRLAIGLTQRKLASLVGCTPGAISHWESGKRQLGVNTCRELIKIFKAYGVNASMDMLTLSCIESGQINFEDIQFAENELERTSKMPGDDVAVS